MRVADALIVVAGALAGTASGAAAQSLPPPAAAYHAPSPYDDDALVPPLNVGAPDDPRYAVQSEPMPPGPYRVPSDEPYFTPAARTAPAVPAAPPAAPPVGWNDTPRPPADVTGSITAPAAPDHATVVAALPPEDQPESGPTKELPPQFQRQLVDYVTSEPAGTVIIDTAHAYLYLIRGGGKALRYGIGVGREGFTWSGAERISRMSEWPDWHPPKEMIERQPYLPRFMAGGAGNPLGARALYLGNTLYRIHGTNQPSTIGRFVSSGCIRMTNADVEDLYSRVNIGTRVIVLPGALPGSAAAQAPPAR